MMILRANIDTVSDDVPSMGFLDSIIGSPTSPADHPPEPTINLPEEEYTVAYPVAVRAEQLAAFQSVIDADRNTPHLDDPGAELITGSLDEVWQKSMPGDNTWSERIESTRTNAEDLIEDWQSRMISDTDVVFLPTGGIRRLEAVLHTCEIRAESEEDPFTLPDEFVDAVSLVKTLQRVKDQKDPVLIHIDQQPDFR